MSTQPAADQREADRDASPRDPWQTPGVVIASVAAATVVVPFLIVYSFLFIARGLFVQVEQPDITSSRHGEAAAGLIALVFLVFVLWGMLRTLNGRNRIVFWIGQLITLAVSIKFVLDNTSGDPQVPVVTGIAAALAIGLSLTRPARRWAASGGGERGPSANATKTAEPDLGLAVMTEPATQQR